MSEKIHIRLATERVNFTVVPGGRTPKIFTPGQIITQQNEFMRGHGTYEDDGYLKASVAGVKEEVNKLISIRPLQSRYNGVIGDVVVGRITEVQQKRWKVDTNSRLDSMLLLSSVNLPGGELRRRSAEDEHMMRKYLQEGDLISAEVQNVFSDGSLSLHTRSLKYGKLSQGILVKVSPTLIKRSKTRFHNLPIGASIIFGNNGFVWISPIVNTEEAGVGGFTQNLEEVVSRTERETIARIRNCILALAQCKMMLYDTSVLYAYEESLKYNVVDLLVPEAIIDVGILTRQRISMVAES
ncbi:exosome complex component RRP4 isoform X1 [Onthophagus taurus]|uniref:exosome complex component RRP4 isoform X1 n=2 Tax=Onthophagus taurus TaxID=166361 RepID=UPI000C20FA58|nr:exosome complex component RRP4 [Onthophagus taurus]